MEPFQLICKSCAAKLKVKNPSAIGQRLACPKCRQMILVESPDGHEAANDTAPTSSFENMDLDSILENKPSPSRKPKRPPLQPLAPGQKQPTAEIILTPTPKVAAKQPSKTDAASRQKMTPSEDWVNPATQKKQRLVLGIMAAIGALLILGVGVFAFISSKSDSDEPVIAKKDPVAIEDPDSVEKSRSGANENASDKAEYSTTAADVATHETPIKDGLDDAVSDEPPPIAIPDVPPNLAIESAGPDNAPEMAVANDNSNRNDTVSTETDVPEKIDEETEKLRKILEESGTSLLALQGAAANVRSSDYVGAPKYFFEKSSLPEVNFNRAKDQVLLSVTYNQQPLQTVLHELSAISGLVLAIDVPAIMSANKDFNPRVTLNAAVQSTADTVRDVAKAVGLVAVETDNGFWISSQQSTDQTERVFDVRELVRDEQGGQRLVQIIRRTVYPDSWRDVDGGGDANIDTSKGTISFADGSVTVDHFDTVALEAGRVIEAISILGNDASQHPLLQTVSSLTSGKFADPFGSKNSIRTPLSSYIRGISDKFGVRIIVDWHSLWNSGWTPGSLAPGVVDEPTVGDMVRETAHGLGVSMYVIDNSTVWLTSPEVAANMFDLKIYRIDSLAAGRLSPARLARILKNSLGNQLFQPGVAIELLPGEKFALVRAPQSLHYQIAAVISKLENPAE